MNKVSTALKIYNKIIDSNLETHRKRIGHPHHLFNAEQTTF